MRISLNEKNIEVPIGCVTLAQLLHTKGFTSLLLHICVNGRHVPLSSAPDIILSDGMSINITHSPNQFPRV